MGACTQSSSCALTNQGIIYTWGKGDYSKQCDISLIPNLMDAMQPRILNSTDVNKNKYIKITAGQTHYAAIDNAQKLFTWGDW